MKKLLITSVLALSFTAVVHTQTVMADDKGELLSIISDIKADMKTKGHQDCSQDFFEPTASDKSLISWSNKFHDDAELAREKALGNTNLGPTTPGGVINACYKAVRMRGAASCVRPQNADYKTKLMQSVNLCEEVLSNL